MSVLAEAGGPRQRPNPLSVIGLSLAPLLCALYLPGVPWPLVALAVLVALVTWSPRLVVVAALLLIAVRADSAVESLEAVATTPVDRQAITALSDPREGAFGQWAIVRIGEDQVIATTSGFGDSLSEVEAHDRLLVSGSVVGRLPESNWEISNRIVGSLRIERVDDHEEATGLAGYANDFRDVLVEGARSLPRQRRALLAGLTVGDDRGQSAVTADNFRAAGLGHLLAVSGQNVVFVLMVATPVLSRIRRPAFRVAATILVLVFFGFVTRFEPSVLRALSMVSLTVIASAVGRPAMADRTLPIAIFGLLTWDPLLAWSLAFQLSVAATLGLLIFAPYLYERSRGPDVLRGLLSVTLAAQLAVAPLLLVFFDDVSLIAVPANLLAVPLSGVIMMWGMTAGFVAGLAPPSLAVVLHMPTNAMLWWVEKVAQTAANLPVAPLGRQGAAAVLAAAVVALASRSFVVERSAQLGILFVAATLAIPLVVPRPLPPGHHQLLDGLSVFRSDAGADLVVMSGVVDAEDVLTSLRKARLGRIDLLVTTSGSRDAGRIVYVVDERYEIVDIWAPPGHQVPNARAVPGFVGVLGRTGVRVDDDGEVDVFTTER